MQSYIALGGNVGSVEATFHAALQELDAHPDIRVTQVSTFLRSAPMGQQAGESYLNATAELQVKIQPLELLDVLQSIETHHGRRRTARWGPRPLDLDLLLYGEEVLNHPRLIVPHPGCWYRRFVLDPLAEIAPQAVHPLKKSTIQDLRARLLTRPLPIALAGGTAEQRENLTEELSRRFSEILISPWLPETTHEPALLLWLGESSDQTLSFAELPRLPRLDLMDFPEDPATAAEHVLQAALG